MSALFYSAVTWEDLEDLVQIRIAAMRESLERVGRFDEARARDRLIKGFDPAIVTGIDLEGMRIGFYAVRQAEDGFVLDHFYIRPEHQGNGWGSLVLQEVLGQVKGATIRLGALKESRSNQFYARHGFRLEHEDELDNYYVFP